MRDTKGMLFCIVNVPYCNFLLLGCMLLLAEIELFFPPYTPYAGAPFGLILYPVAIHQDLQTRVCVPQSGVKP